MGRRKGGKGKQIFDKQPLGKIVDLGTEKKWRSYSQILVHVLNKDLTNELYHLKCSESLLGKPFLSNLGCKHCALETCFLECEFYSIHCLAVYEISFLYS